MSPAPDMRRCRELLFHMLPKAKAMVASGKIESFVQSAAGSVFQGQFTESHLGGVHIYEDNGGWYGDVILIGVPLGSPNSFGNPAHMPFNNRIDAEESAIGCLAMFLHGCTNPKPPVTEIIFSYYSFYIPIPRVFFEKIEEHAKKVSVSIEYCEMRLAQTDKALFGALPPTEEAMNALSDTGNLSLLTVAAMSLCAGLLRWPRRDIEEPASAEEIAARVMADMAQDRV